LRRKKSGVHCDTGGNNNKSRIKAITAAEDKQSTDTKPNGVCPEALQDLKRSQSLPCAANSTSSARDSIDRQSGKSAPIDIAPNPRSPPIKLTEKQIDSEILKLKLEESDLKNLRSIEELSDDDFSADSPVDLPGSVERRRFSMSPSKVQEEPVVVKASMTAKVSPKGSFAETVNGRDSANNSPTEELDHLDTNGNPTQTGNGPVRNEPIASPPLSLCSLRSGDSGKGSSPPQSEGGALFSVYDFLVPVSLVQHLIGTKGRYVNQLKAKTGVNMIVKKHPATNKLRICSLEGTQKEIDAALQMLRSKMPSKRYPQVTLERVFFTESNTVIPLPALDPNCLQLQLIEGINNDVVISAVISGGQVFLQQPLHPSYPQLNVLQTFMSQSYSCIEAPALAEVLDSAICAAPVYGHWYRVQVISHNPQTDSALVKYLDYGGYVSVSAKELRQIRTDFMTVPFQATEVLLSNIKPVGDEWLPEAAEVLYSLTSGIVLQAQIAGYTYDGYPEVYLYACLAKDNVVFINKELVARGLAVWVEDNTTDAAHIETATA